MADQLEQKSEVKRLQLSSETASIAFQAKQREYDTLLQLNQEVTHTHAHMHARTHTHTHTQTHTHMHAHTHTHTPISWQFSTEYSKLKQQCASLQQDRTRHEEDSNEEELLTDENQSFGDTLQVCVSMLSSMLLLIAPPSQEELSEMQAVNQQQQGTTHW